MTRPYIVSATPSLRVMAVSAAALLAIGAACNATSTDPVVGREVDVIPGAPPPTYPVDPRVHVEDPSLDPSQPGTIKARVLNAVAYARYGVQTLSTDGAVVPEDPDGLTLALSALGSASGVPASRAAQLYAMEASEAEREPYRAHVLTGARGVEPSARLSAVGARIVDLEKQIATCTASDVGGAGDAAPTASACCAALAVPWFLLDAASKLDERARAAFEAEGQQGTLFSALPARLLAEATTRAAANGTAVQPFEHQNIKAFLSVCAPVARRAPATVAALKARYGDYTSGPRWTTELHPISMAKLAPRRIYRSWDNKVSVAESIGEACEVRETEVVVERPNGVLDFWSYGAGGEREMHGFFPARLGVDVVKHTPDSCMGCHYKLDSRAFDVRAPSYVALGLVLRKSQGVPQWVDGSACAREGETLVWHERPANP